MATLTIRNLPDDLHRALRARAADHRRSINREAIACLEAVLIGPVELDDPALLRDLHVLREEADVYVTDDILREAIDAGRTCRW